MHPTHDAPPDDAFFLPHDAFDADWSDAWTEATEPILFVEADALFEPPTDPPPHDERWAWHDARWIGVERAGEVSLFEIGCIDLYAEADGRDLAGSYLPVAAFADEGVATAFYHDLLTQTDARGVLPSALPTFALEQAQVFDPAAAWRPATRDEIAAYEFQRELERWPAIDAPDPALDDLLLARAAELGGVVRDAPTFDDPSAFHALHAIGLDTQGFDPQQDPPPFYDAESGTAYWIGVFLPDGDDREHCVASILSLAKTDAGYEAQLAPCVTGDWDHAYQAAEFLIAQVEKGGIERAFDAAEGMALATEQRDLWDAERGVALGDTVTQDLADYASQWNMER